MQASEVLFIAGLVIALLGGIWLIVAAFHESLLWGLACLLCSPAQLLFLVLRWHAAHKPFLASVGGVLLMAVGSYLWSPPERPPSYPGGSVVHTLMTRAREPRETLVEATEVGTQAAKKVRGDSRPPTLYRWTEADGTVSYTDSFDAIPERYRSRAQTTLGGDLSVVESAPPAGARGARRSGSVRLLVFRADWCPACRQLERSGLIERFAAKHSDLSVERVDVDRDKRQAERYRVRAIPTAVFVDSEGTELARPDSASSEAALERALASVRGP